IALSLVTIATGKTTATNNGLDNIALAQTQGTNNTANSSAAVTNIDTLRANGQIFSLASDVLVGRPSVGIVNIYLFVKVTRFA
ncbi:MAG TPA: hypothetical protein VI278_07005, partial [Nitrososphaeraceae archaeon]